MKKFLVLLVILIFPSALYVFLTAGKERSFVKLNYYGPKRPIHINKDGKSITDTVYYHIPAFSFYDQHGTKVADNSLAGKIWVACFTSLADKQYTPSMSILMNRVEERTNLDTALRLVTFALDSANAATLATYANMVHAGKKQIFLGGNSAGEKQLATDGFYNPVDTSYSKGFTHFFLIDKEGCIRGIYSGLKIKDIDLLIDEIGMLEAAYFIQNERKNKDKDREQPL